MDKEMQERLIKNSEKALLIGYKKNFIITIEGRVPKKDRRLYFYHMNGRNVLTRTCQINDEPGVIRCRTLWFPWDGTRSNKLELIEKAIVIFMQHYEDKREKARKDFEDAASDIARLEYILTDIRTWVK